MKNGGEDRGGKGVRSSRRRAFPFDAVNGETSSDRVNGGFGVPSSPAGEGVPTIVVCMIDCSVVVQYEASQATLDSPVKMVHRASSIGICCHELRHQMTPKVLL